MVEVERQQAVREETLRNIDIRLKGIETTLSRLTWLYDDSRPLAVRR